MITLAVVTGIPEDKWAEAGSRGIATAIDVIATLRAGRSASTQDDADRPQYSG